MPLDEPPWWYTRPQGPVHVFVRSLLYPAAIAYSAIAGSRMRRRPVDRVAIPVICIGNFTAGGTGKTPLAMKIAQLLRDIGQTPAFLSRGFGGSRRGPHRVDVGVDQASEVGDEPLLLAATAPTIIARDRAAGARYIAEHALGSVIIMDDGLQNPSLAKDLSIAVVDSERGIGNGCVIPAGPLRAEIGQQLAVTDAIVIVRQPMQPDQPHLHTLELPPPLQSFDGLYFNASVEAQSTVERITSRPILAFAGIGNPDRFFRLLEELGGDVRVGRAFRDHHAFDDNELAQLLADADRSGLQLVTTAKDFVRLDSRSDIARLVREQSHVLQIQMTFSPADQQSLTDLLLRFIARD